MKDNPRDKDYDIGLYHNYRFNAKDLALRKDLGLIAEEFIPEENISLVLRKLAKDPLSSFAVFPVPLMIEEVQSTDYVLYVPIGPYETANAQASQSTQLQKKPAHVLEAIEEDELFETGHYPDLEE